jgi:FKBP-type peptidyl-prolyl cis-trans isomerase SlyD
MKIANDTVATFHYALKDDQGAAIESSRTRGTPQVYLHGHSGLITGLETAMLGREKGDSFSVTAAPSEAYGERVEDRVQRVPLKHLVKAGKLSVGMWVQVKTDSGVQVAVVKKVGMTVADLDLNHPMAGKTLVFDVEILDVRAATEEEIAHKHVHGEGGVAH